MKECNKEKSKTKMKMHTKNNNNQNDKYNNKDNNQLYPIKYFCFNEVKKIVNNKNKKSPHIDKANKKQKLIKRDDEDYYPLSIYNKKLFIITHKSSPNILQNIYKLNDVKERHNSNKYNSTDERYKAINKYGYYTKILFNDYQRLQIFKGGDTEIEKCRFSKKNKKKSKLKNKTKTKKNNYLNIQDITNINNNNIIYRTNNITEYNNNLTSNSITSKTITNNTMSNYTISNITSNSCCNKSNNTNKNTIKNISKNKKLDNKKFNKKNNNLKVLQNKGRNKNIKNKNTKNKEKESTIYVRRIILEEKYTIDSKGDKKTIYVKKISPSIKIKKYINSADKSFKKNKKINKNNNSYNNRDNTFINHNDINLNFNVCAFQKINLNNKINNNNNNNVSKLESYEEENKLINNDSSINDSIRQGYKDFLNLKNSKKIIYKKPNIILYKSDNHRSYKSLISSPNKRYIIKIIGNNNNNKKKIKKTQKTINNINPNIINNKKNNSIKKNSNKKNISNNSPLKYVLVNQRYLKNKFVYRKTKTNFIQTNINNIDNKKILKSDFYQKDEKNNSLSNKRSFSFVGKNRIYNLSKKLKETKKLDMRDRINTNNTPTAHTSYQKNKLNEYLHFSPSSSAMTSKNNTKVNSINNSKYLNKKINNSNKSNACIKSNDNSLYKMRSHSLNKIISKNNYIFKDVKSFENYMKNNMASSSGRNKSHRNFILKKFEKYNFENILNGIRKNNNNKKSYHSNIVYLKNKSKEKNIKN